MAGVSFSMVRPQRLVEEDNENLVEDSSNNLAQRLKQQQMATDTKVSRVLERMDRPSLKCSLQIILLSLLTIAVIIIAAKLLSSGGSGASDQDKVIDIHKKILEVLTRNDYKSPEAVCPSKLFEEVGPPGRWDSCYYLHKKASGPSSEVKTMEEARFLCSKIGGHVVALETKEETQYIQHLSSYGNSYPSWIAASNAGDGVDWLWIQAGKDGGDVSVNYSNWAADEPRHKVDYHCAHIGEDSTWVTSKCDSKRVVMCEAPAKGSGTVNLLLSENKPPERFCPDNSSSCYVFVNTRLSWQRAQDHCVEFGGFLARPDSLEKNTLLKDHIYSILPAPSSHRVRWLGAQGKRLEMKWISNGKLLSDSFQDWRSEMGPTDEDLCLAYNITSRLIPHHWSAASCFRWLPFICEIPVSEDVAETVEASVISEPKQMFIVDERAECAFESNGVDFRGTRASSSTGSTCLPWKHFHSHELVVDALFNHKLEENYCRNPNNESAPWCFVGSRVHPRWEYCNIPSCNNKDFINESHLCGPGRPKYGLPSTCDGSGARPCCSAAGFCGPDRSDCKCFGCKDFRPDEFVHPLLGPNYIPGENGLFYGHKKQTISWAEAREVCKEDGGDMAGMNLFQSKDLPKLLQRVLSGESQRHPSLVRGKATYWLGLSTAEDLSESDVAYPWKWVSGDALNETVDFNDLLDHRSYYELRLTTNSSDSSRGCAALWLNRYRERPLDFGTLDYSVGAVADLDCDSVKEFICEVDVKEDSTTTTPEPSPILTVTSINSSFTLHFVKSQKSHDSAEKFCAENFSAGKMVRLDSEEKREQLGKLALEVMDKPSSESGNEDPPPLESVTVLSYWWVGEGSTLTSRVKLAQGNNVSSGNVYIGNQPVCDDGWDNKDAQVVCRQLGFLNGTAKFNSHFGVVPSNFAMDQVECLGHEEYLKLCPHSKVHDCGSSEGAGVSCTGKQSSEQIASRRQKKVCQRVTYTDESIARYNPPWSTLVQVNCQFSHWFICESDAQRIVTQYSVTTPTTTTTTTYTKTTTTTTTTTP